MLSIRTGDPEAGLRFIAPEDVLMLTAASPWLISSALTEDADIPVKFEPSPENVVAANVPETVRVPFAKFIKSVSSTCPTYVPSILTKSTVALSSIASPLRSIVVPLISTSLSDTRSRTPSAL